MSSPANPLATEAIAVPPKLATRRAAGRYGLMIAAVALAGVGALLFWFNPAEHAFYPQCFFHKVTGWHCPGCGGLRAVHQLLHGHLLAALHLNGLAVFSLPLFAGLLWREFAGRRFEAKGRRYVCPRLIWSFVGALLAFSVLRNFPGFAFLAP
jgi:hypothetical protein